MIQITRSTVLKFRSVYRKSVGLKASRVQSPVVVLEAGPEGIQLISRCPELQVRLKVDAPRQPFAQFPFSADHLIRIEGRSESPVSFESEEGKPRSIRWDDRGIPQVLTVNDVIPEDLPPLKDKPKEWARMPEAFLQVLDDASRSAARADTKYVVSHLQLRGLAGEVVATDTRELFIQTGITFPFREDILVPALPVFGLKELAGQDEIHLGLTKTHLAIETGPWRFDLTIKKEGRFPDCRSIVPSSKKGTTLQISEADAAFLSASLSRLPGVKDDVNAITLDLDSTAALRSAHEGTVTEIALSSSTVTGPSLRIALNRQYLERALKIGFRSLLMTTHDKPLLAKDANRIFVFMPLSMHDIVAPNSAAVRIDSASVPIPIPRSSVMPSAIVPRPPRPNEVAAPVTEPIRPLIDADRVQTVLIEVLQRATHLIVILSGSDRVRTVVRTALDALKRLASRK